MAKWIYHTLRFPFGLATDPTYTNVLNDIGEMGYELVSTATNGVDIVYVFKQAYDDAAKAEAMPSNSN